MTHDDVLRQLTRLVADALDLPDLVLTAQMSAKDVPGWDSLAHVQIIVAVERSFGIRLRTGEIAGLASIGELVERIAAKIPRV
jgi:acyl carrier protein